MEDKYSKQSNNKSLFGSKTKEKDESNMWNAEPGFPGASPTSRAVGAEKKKYTISKESNALFKDWDAVAPGLVAGKWQNEKKASASDRKLSSESTKTEKMWGSSSQTQRTHPEKTTNIPERYEVTSRQTYYIPTKLKNKTPVIFTQR